MVIRLTEPQKGTALHCRPVVLQKALTDFGGRVRFVGRVPIAIGVVAIYRHLQAQARAQGDGQIEQLQAESSYICPAVWV